MSLRDRFRKGTPGSPVASTTTEAEPANHRPQAAPPSAPDEYQELKRRLHREMIGKLNMALLEGLDENGRRDQVESVARRLLSDSDLRLTRSDEERLVQELLHDTFDLGPITPYLLDEEISDILVNTHRQVYVERLGRLELTPVQFRDEAHLRLIIDRIISRVGRRIDESSPLVDARLPDGSRVNAIIPPLSLTGALLTIRKFARNRFDLGELIQIGTLSAPAADFLGRCIEADLNMLVSGGTGTGKTTMLNALSAAIPDRDRIVTIEDAAELQLVQRHVLRLEARPKNIEGEGEITIRDLVRNALRMRPDRIVVGEVRGAEALDMLQAMNTGHEGSLSTIHANSARDALSRLETMVLMAGYDLPLRAIRQHVSSALDLIVQIDRLDDGSRRITGIAEVQRMEGEMITLQNLFEFKIDRIDAERKVIGSLQPTGLRPSFLGKFEQHGIELPLELFGNSATAMFGSQNGNHTWAGDRS